MTSDDAKNRTSNPTNQPTVDLVSSHHRRVPVLVPISHRQPTPQKKLCGRRCTRTRRGVQGRVAVSVQSFHVHAVGGQEFQAAQEAFPVAGDVERGLAELVPFVDVEAPLLEQPPHLRAGSSR